MAKVKIRRWAFNPEQCEPQSLNSVRLFDFLHKYLAAGAVGSRRNWATATHHTRKFHLCRYLQDKKNSSLHSEILQLSVLFSLSKITFFRSSSSSSSRKIKKSTSSTKHTRHYNDTPYIKLRRALYNNIYWTVLWMLREKQHEISAKTLNIEKEKSERKKAILNSFQSREIRFILEDIEIH